MTTFSWREFNESSVNTAHGVVIQAALELVHFIVAEICHVNNIDNGDAFIILNALDYQTQWDLTQHHHAAQG